MSFAFDVKQEIARIDLTDAPAKAQLAAMIQASLSSCDLEVGTLSLQFNQVFVAKRAVVLLKMCYRVDCEIEYTEKKGMTNTSLTLITVREKVKLILEDVGLLSDQKLLDKILVSRVASEESLRAYIAGWFLVRGSVNDPSSSNYHFELRFSQIEQAQYIKTSLDRFKIIAKIIKRRHEQVLYIKASDRISDMLRLMGAHQALLVFENVRIHRDFHNSLTRLDNCEVSNEMKTIETGRKQVEAIEKLILHHRLEYMEQRLQDIALLRIKFPEHSLRELAEEYLIESGDAMSKSGIKHRLDKLMDAANRIND